MISERIKALLSLLVIAFISGLIVAKPSTAQEPGEVPPPAGDPLAFCESEVPTETPLQCLGRELTDYMNGTLDELEDRNVTLNHVKLLSPAFNLTSGFTPVMYSNMVLCGARFPDLWGFSGNVYTLDGVRAMDFYINNGWAAAFAGKPVIFTEFGDFGTSEIGFDGQGRENLIGAMEAEYRRALGMGIFGINYFASVKDDTNGLPVNEQFYAIHGITTEEFLRITASSPSVAGLNQGLWALGGVVQQNVGRLGRRWAVEIVGGPDVENIERAVNDYPNVNTVVRLCVGANSCGSLDEPDEMANYLIALDNAVNRDVWVIVGPNEPVSEPWVAPECELQDIEFVGGGPAALPPSPQSPPPAPSPPPYARCDEVYYPEFHSLRPYPTSSCINTIFSQVRMCANDFTARQVVVASRDDATSCTPIDEFTESCNFQVTSTMNIEVAATQSRFPIMGNTELVPNSQSREDELTYPQRVNEYVSWYLNGTTNRAEEEDENILRNQFISDDQRLERVEEVINFSGPIKKLFPFDIQHGFYYRQGQWWQEVLSGLRPDQVKDADTSFRGQGFIRHNQIVVCAARQGIIGRALPIPCYEGRGDEIIARLTQDPNNPFDIDLIPWVGDIGGALFLTSLNPIWSFTPMSSTEDLYGRLTYDFAEVDTSMDPDSLSFSVNLPGQDAVLSFAHIVETVQLANELQKTYTSLDFVTEDDPVQSDARVIYGDPPLGQYFDQNDEENCEIVETRTNPGDLLYGVIDDGDPDRIFQSPQEEGSITYTAEFTCELPIPIPDPTCVLSCQEGQLLVPPLYPPDLDCIEFCEPPPPLCYQFIDFTMDVESSTPLAHNIYDKFVAGDYAIFRRMFPRVEEGAPIDFIEDIPAEDRVWYNAYNTSIEGAGNAGTGPIAGDPDDNRSGARAQLYFPHIGSVHQYFLQDIQRALRPWGIGNTPVGVDQDGNIECTAEVDLLSLPPADPSCTGACNGYTFESPTMQAIFESAASAYNVPVSVLLGIFFSEGGLNSNDDRSESAVLQASGPNCEVTDCDSNVSGSGARGPWQFIPSTWNTVSSAVIDAGVSDGREPNICNLLDSTFAAARLLSIGVNGHSGYPTGAGGQCFGVAYNRGSKQGSGCAWTDSDVTTAARQYLGYCQEPGHPDSSLSYYVPCPGSNATCYQMRVRNFCPAP